MFSWLNHHSFFLLVLAISGLTLIITSAINRVWFSSLIFGFVIILLSTGYLMLRTGNSTHATDVDVSEIVSTDTPTLLEFYSDY